MQNYEQFKMPFLNLNKMISFGFFFNLICFVFSSSYYFLIEKKILSSILRYSIIILLILNTFFLIKDIPSFITEDSEIILENFNYFILDVFTFNISILLFGSSLIIFLISLFKRTDYILEFKHPSIRDARKGKIKIGKIKNRNSVDFNFYLSLEDLEKHMFVCGSTGTGKSNFLQHFLMNFSKKCNIPFFLVEFKGEYHFLQQKIENLLILWPGENFSINIFDPLDANPIIHAERIFDILKSGQFLEENVEYSPQMEKVLIEILSEVCSIKIYQNWKGFEECCERYIKKNYDKVPMLKQTIISVKNRIRRFSNGPLKAIFETNTIFSTSVLFKKNIILDLSSIIRLGGEKQDALFFLNMILKYLWDKNLSNGAFNYEGIKHLTIIEDAQYFAPQDLVKKSKITSYLEDIALIQRGTGECLITLATRPNISKEILANNGVVVTFKNHIEKEIMCELMNIDAENKNVLSTLDKGECIIRINSLKMPFILTIPLIKRDFITISEIERKNRQIMQNKAFQKNYHIFHNLRLNLIKFLRNLFTIKRYIDKSTYQLKEKKMVSTKKPTTQIKFNERLVNKSPPSDYKIKDIDIEKLSKLINKICNQEKSNK